MTGCIPKCTVRYFGYYFYFYTKLKCSKNFFANVKLLAFSNIIFIVSEVISCFKMYNICSWKRTYHIVEKTKEEADWGRNWSASFYLDVKTSSFTRQDEFYAYDIWDLTSGLGGLMGLFIGWSFLSIIFLLYELSERMIVLCCNRQDKVYDLTK